VGARVCAFTKRRASGTPRHKLSRRGSVLRAGYETKVEEGGGGSNGAGDNVKKAVRGRHSCVHEEER
jgi:hypothetical protein